MATIGSHSSYDEVPYEGGAVPGSHPEHLAALGRLFGMEPADVTGCRVLEIGCALGANLLPMAYSLPNSRFVGIDSSARQIEMGQALAREFEAANLELLVADVRDLSGLEGTFDYIICHGVLTWVPPEVQDAILAACRDLLAPQGIAYISYNTLPGFHMRAGVGEMLRFHARNFEGAKERTEQAKALLDFLLTATSKFNQNDETLGPYHHLLARESRILHSAPGYYLMHEHLVDEPSAFYLHEFIEFVDHHQLQYLGDTDFHTMMVRDLPEDVAESVNTIAPNQVALEQYRDFVVNRMFRRSLVCRSDVEVKRHISTEAIRSCKYRGQLTRSDGEPWTISKVGGFAAAVSDPQVEAVLEALDAALPLSLDFASLSGQLREQHSMDDDHLCAILLSLLSLDAIEFRTWSPDAASTISERPEAFMPARKRAAAGFESLPTPYHESKPFEAFVCRLVAFLDGRKSQEALAAIMKSALDAGEVRFANRQEGKVIELAQVERLVGEALELLRRAGLLVS